MKCLWSASSIPPPSESQGLPVPWSHARKPFAAVGCPLHCGRLYPHPWVIRYYPDNDKPSLTISFHHTPWIMEATAPHKDSGSLSAWAGIGRITFSGRCMHSSWHPLDQSGHPSTASASGMPAVLLITRTMNMLSPGLHWEGQGSEHQDCFPHLITYRLQKDELFVHPHGSCSPASPPGMGLEVSAHPSPPSGMHASPSPPWGPQPAAPLHRHGSSSPVLSAFSVTFLATHSISTNTCLHSPGEISGCSATDKLKETKANS